MARSSFALPAVAGALALVGCNLLNAPPPVPPATPSPSASVTTSPAPSPGPSASPRPTRPYLFVMSGGTSNEPGLLDKVDLGTGTVSKNVLTLGKVMNQLQVSGTTGYAVSYQDNKIFKLDLSAPAKAGEFVFPAGTGPQTLTFFGSNKGLAAADSGKAALFLDLGAGTVEASVSIGIKPGLGGTAIAQRKAYVPVYNLDASWNVIDSAIKVVDLESRAVVKTFPLASDANPYATAVAPDGKIHVAIKTGVMTIDPANDATGSIDLGGQVTSIQFASAEKAYAMTGTAPFSYDGLAVYNPSTGAVLRDAANRIRTGSSSGNFKIRGNFAYVPGGFGTDTVKVVDLTAEATTSTVYQVSPNPQDVAIVDIPQ